MTIQFFVPGDPKGQPRARRGAGKHMYTPDTANGFKECIYAVAREHTPKVPLTGPVSMTVTAVFARPKSHYGTGKNADKLRSDAPHYHTSKPDRDNVEKAILDALTRLGFWKDDAQVCDGRMTKIYEGGVPMKVGCYVVITALATKPDPSHYAALSAELAAMREVLEAARMLKSNYTRTGLGKHMVTTVFNDDFDGLDAALARAATVKGE